MKLTFSKEYEDYTDSAHWLPRFAQLKSTVSGFTGDVIGRMDPDALLCAMEDTEELMRYYCATRDLKNLETVMRKFYEMLQLCKAQQGETVQALYLEMVFLRIDAMLYRSTDQHRQSAQSYDRCVAVARKCVAAAKQATLPSEQRFYVGWNCVECWKEAAEAHDLALDTPGAVQLLREVIPVLQWLEPDMADAAGICDQASEIYTHAGTTLYQNGDPATGSRCLQSAYGLLRRLDEVHGSDFYMARAIWIRGIHGMHALMVEGNAQMMLQCEAEAEDYLRQRAGASVRDRAIAEAAKAIVLLQRSVAFQQNGKLQEAIAMADNGVSQLKISLDVLKEDYQDRAGYYRMVMEKITGRVYSSYVGAMESLGVMHFQNNDEATAESMLKAVLKELTETGGLRMLGSSSSLIQAEVLQYLGIIASDTADAYQAEFYGTQAADMALSLAEEGGNPAAWGIGVISCSLVAEVALNMKNKQKALIYADKGLTACDMLERLNPSSPQLQIRGNLQKFKRKASRKFF